MAAATTPVPAVRADDATAPPAAPAPWRTLARAEAARLTATRAVRLLGLAVALAPVAYALSKLFLHGTDVAGAWREAEEEYRRLTARGRELGLSTEGTRVDHFYDEPRYIFATEVFVDMRAVLSAVAVAALAFGVVAGGNDWGSRVMVTLTAAEPRRTRLFATRAAVVAAVTAAAAAAAGAVIVPLLLLAARVRGTLAGTGAHTWAVLAGQYGRGVVLVALFGLLGYALGMAARRTVVAFGVVLAYLTLAGQIIGDVLGADTEYRFQGLVFAVLNDHPVIPLAESACFAGPGCAAAHVDLTPATGFLVILAHLLPVLAAAWWRTTRTDIT